MSRLVREVVLMELLDHPNIVHLHETIETADSLFLVMEYVPGMNLDEHLIGSDGLLGENEARAIFRQMVSAVDYCHRRWVVHRDLKAPNVMLTPQGQVRLADFGLGNRYGLHRLRTICGSMLYYSPEIISGQKYVGPEVDCWCLGITLFRMTAGFELFSHARTASELKKIVLSRHYPMPAHLSDALKQTIQKCLAFDRKKRRGVRHALRNDPWMNDHGKLKDVFEDSPDVTMADLMLVTGERDGDDRRVGQDLDSGNGNGSGSGSGNSNGRNGHDGNGSQKMQKANRTVVYHPLHPSIYFTSNSAHSPVLQDNIPYQEQVCGLLFKDLQKRLSHIDLRYSQPHPTSRLSRLFHVESTTDRLLRRSTSALNLPQLNPSVNKDHIYHYSVKSCSTAPPITATTATHAFAFDESLYAAEHDEHAVALLIASVCQILGVTYHHTTSSSLDCVFSLHPSVQKTKSNPLLPPKSPELKSNRRWHDRLLSWPLSIQSGSLSPSLSPFNHHHNNNSNHSNNNNNNNNSSSGQHNRNSPPFASSDQSMFGLWDDSLQKSPRQEPIFTNTSPTFAPLRNAQTIDQSAQESILFTVRVFVDPIQKSGNTMRGMGVQFIKTKGSSKVFKLATNWIHDVLVSSTIMK
ncbi:kinase-like domain-containing protein [Phycomyces blakesleeanus]